MVAEILKSRQDVSEKESKVAFISEELQRRMSCQVKETITPESILNAVVSPVLVANVALLEKGGGGIARYGEGDITKRIKEEPKKKKGLFPFRKKEKDKPSMAYRDSADILGFGPDNKRPNEFRTVMKKPTELTARDIERYHPLAWEMNVKLEEIEKNLIALTDDDLKQVLGEFKELENSLVLRKRDIVFQVLSKKFVALFEHYKNHKEAYHENDDFRMIVDSYLEKQVMEPAEFMVMDNKDKAELIQSSNKLEKEMADEFVLQRVREDIALVLKSHNQALLKRKEVNRVIVYLERMEQELVSEWQLSVNQKEKLKEVYIYINRNLTADNDARRLDDNNLLLRSLYSKLRSLEQNELTNRESLLKMLSNYQEALTTEDTANILALMQAFETNKDNLEKTIGEEGLSQVDNLLEEKKAHNLLMRAAHWVVVSEKNIDNLISTLERKDAFSEKELDLFSTKLNIIESNLNKLIRFSENNRDFSLPKELEEKRGKLIEMLGEKRKMVKIGGTDSSAELRQVRRRA